MTTEILAPMLVVAVAYLAMFSVGELLRRGRRTAATETRRFDHVMAGGIALALPILFDSPWPVIALAVPFVGFLLGTMVIGWLGSVHAIPRRSVGAFLYPVAIAVTFVIAADRYAWYAIAVLALALADPAGGITGARMGRHVYRAWGQVKTREGSIAVLAVSAVLTSSVLLIGGESVAVAGLTGLFTGLTVALVEGALPWGLDNLGIPLAVLASLAAAGSITLGGLTLLSAAALLALALVASRLRDRRPEPSVPGAVAADAP
jgi:dolichol kinase